MSKPMDISARKVQASTEDGGIVDFTGQDKVEIPFGIEYTRIYFILHNKHQSVMGRYE